MSTITVPRAVLEQVLEALELPSHLAIWNVRRDIAISALRTALAQPNEDYERGFVDGMSEQAKRSVDRAVNALAQQEQEPVAWRVHPFDYGIGSEGVYAMTQRPDQVKAWERKGWTVQQLYIRPPRREWRGLKEWEINDGRDQLPTEDLCNWSFRQGVYFAEAALKEKNQ